MGNKASFWVSSKITRVKYENQVIFNTKKKRITHKIRYTEEPLPEREIKDL